MICNFFREIKLLIALLFSLFAVGLAQASEYNLNYQPDSNYNSNIDSTINLQYSSFIKIDGLKDTPLSKKAMGGILGFAVGSSLGTKLLVELSKCGDRNKDVTCISEFVLGYGIGGAIGVYYGLKLVALPYRNTIKFTFDF